MKKKKINLVTSMTPHRISFAGGGSDIPHYFKKLGGKIINCTIDKFVYVTVKRHHQVFNEMFRIMYSKTEHKNDIKKIENDIVRESIKLTKVKGPILISTHSDVIVGSGLGSSSAFTVGLLNALYTFNGKKISSFELAKKACEIEIKILKKNGGIQDQFASAVGGLNKFIIQKNGMVKNKKLKLKKDKINKIFKNLLLIWSNQSRSSESISKTYKKDFSSIKAIINNVDLFHKLITDRKLDLKKIGNFLNISWLMKKKLSSKISNSNLDKTYNFMKKAGALGGKISGAGGGGFFIFLMPQNKQKKIMNKKILSSCMNVNYYPKGTKIISKIYDTI